MSVYVCVCVCSMVKGCLNPDPCLVKIVGTISVRGYLLTFGNEMTACPPAYSGGSWCICNVFLSFRERVTLCVCLIREAYPFPRPRPNEPYVPVTTPRDS